MIADTITTEAEAEAAALVIRLTVERDARVFEFADGSALGGNGVLQAVTTSDGGSTYIGADGHVYAAR